MPRLFDLNMGKPAVLRETTTRIEPTNQSAPHPVDIAPVDQDPCCVANEAPTITRIERIKQSHPPGDVLVDQDPCLTPIVLALRTVPETKDQTWTVDERLQHLFDMNLAEVFDWARDNHELQIGVADKTNIEDKWGQVIGTGKPPVLEGDGDFCVIYHWAVNLSWQMMGASARKAQYDVPCGTGNAHPIYVKGIGRVTELHGLVALHFDFGDRTFILSGTPHPTPIAVETIRRLHAGEGVEVNVDGSDEVQLLPVEFVGRHDTSTALMGLDLLVGSQTPTYRVTKAAGNCAVAIDLEGIRAEAMGYAVVRYRSMFTKNPPGKWNFHDEKGNQWLRLTVRKGGRVEFGIELGNAHHKACK